MKKKEEIHAACKNVSYNLCEISIEVYSDLLSQK